MAELPLCQPLPELPTGGYDDDYFLDPPAESLHCPVCLLVLREPHLMSCCGAHICQVCIEHIQANEQSCPCCRSENYINVLNKNERGKILELKVCCLNSVKGCQWVGELGDQERHFANKCQYAVDVCRYGCGGNYPRFLLHTHEQDECPERPIEMKMATFTKKMLEKVNTLENKYQEEIIKLNKKLKDQEEKHKMELQEKEEEKSMMQRQSEMKSEEDKKEMYQLMTIQQEKHKLQSREMKEKMKEDRQELHKLQNIVEKNKEEAMIQQAEILQLKEEVSHLIEFEKKTMDFRKQQLLEINGLKQQIKATGGKKDVSDEPKPKSKPPIDRKVVHEGFLTRRGNILSRKFIKEFVSLEAEGRILKAYNDDSLKAIKQQIVLQECVSVRTRTKEDAFLIWPTDVEAERCFVVITNNPHYFIADTEENAREWIHKISEAKTKFSLHIGPLRYY